MATFPTVTGANLEGERFTLPHDLAGQLNLLFIPFQRWHQDWVDTWIPTAKQLVAAYPQLRFYELPTLPPLNPFARLSIDFGMKMGIPDRAARAATITLYVDKERYRHALEIASEQTITLLLVEPSGKICWRAEGPFVQDTARQLTAVIQRYFAPLTSADPERHSQN